MSILLVLPLVMLFAGCEQTTVSVLPGEPAGPEDPGSPGGSDPTDDPGSSDEPGSGDAGDPDGPGTSQMVHPDWPVRLPDGAVLTELEVKSDRLKYRLETDLDYEDIYDRLHTDIVADGWERDDLDKKKRGIEAEYERKDLELEVKVERDGDEVKVDIELDD